MLHLINPYVAKIAIAAKDNDSIRKISKKINESYGWTYRWILELEKIGTIKRKKQQISINKNSAFYKEMVKLIKTSLKNNLSLSDAYLLPSLSGLDYIFTNTDAVFTWTKGGYNIGRSKDSYPIFIEVLEQDKPGWGQFFSKLNINYTFRNEKRKGVYFVILFGKSLEAEYCDGIPVLPLAKTVDWAKKYSFNFQPALEMLDKLYDLKIGVKYAEI